MARPQLHVTAMNTLWRCGEQYRRRYVEGQRRPPNVAMIVGTGTDKSVTANVGSKILTGEHLPIEQVCDVARDAVNAAWGVEGVELQPDERSRGEAEVKGEAVDKAVRLSRLHAVRLAPTLTATHVQRPWVMEIPDFPFDLAGTIDIQEGRASVRDTKARAKSPTQAEVDSSEQLSLYALACLVLDGVRPAKVCLDCLVDLKRGPEVRVVESIRTGADALSTMARIENAAKVIQAGVFTPANPTDWWCSERWCGYWRDCPYAHHRVSVAVDGANTGENDG